MEWEMELKQVPSGNKNSCYPPPFARVWGSEFFTELQILLNKQNSIETFINLQVTSWIKDSN